MEAQFQDLPQRATDATSSVLEAICIIKELRIAKVREMEQPGGRFRPSSPAADNTRDRSAGEQQHRVDRGRCF